jgi:hypothetical protein
MITNVRSIEIRRTRKIKKNVVYGGSFEEIGIRR